jgi:hypothetical protein
MSHVEALGFKINPSLLFACHYLFTFFPICNKKKHFSVIHEQAESIARGLRRQNELLFGVLDNKSLTESK